MTDRQSRVDSVLDSEQGAHALHILLLEDRSEDVELIRAELSRAGLGADLRSVGDRPSFLTALEDGPDVILADFHLPRYNALAALEDVRRRGLSTPFLVVSGTIGEEKAVECLQQGADDYLLKDRLARLGPAVERALEKRRLRRQADDATLSLAESERHFRALIENMAEAISVIAADGTIVYESPAVRTVLGFAPEELVGRNAFDLLHPHDLERCQGLFRSLLETPGGVVTATFRFRNQQGEFRLLEATGQNLLNDPSVRGIVANYRDITARQEAEERIRFQAHLLDRVGQAVLAFDLQGRILYWNHHAGVIYGCSAEESIGQNAFELSCGPVGPPLSDDVLAKLRAGRTWSGEFLCRQADGETLPGLASYSPIFDDKGGLHAVICVLADTRGLKQAEEERARAERRYRTLVEQLPAVTFTVDLGPPSRTTYISPQLRQVLGVDPEEWMRDPRMWTRHVHPEDLPRVSQSFADHDASGEDLNIEYRALAADGSTRWIRHLARTIPDEAGRAKESLGLHIDITDLKNAEAETQRRNQELAAQRERLESLRQASLAMSSFLDLQSVLHTTAHFAQALTRSHNAHVFLWEDDRPVFGSAYWEGKLHLEPREEPRPNGVTARVGRSGTRLVVPDVNRDPLFEGTGWNGAIAAVPIRTKTRVLGVLNVAHQRPHEFSEDEVHLLELLADQAARAIENARLFEAQSQRAKELTTIVSLATKLRAAEQRRDMVPAILEEVLAILQADAAGLDRYDLESGWAELEAGIGLWRPAEGFRSPLRDGVSAYVLRDRKMYYTRDVRLEPDFPWPSGLMGIFSVAVVPLVAEGRIEGGLWVGWTDPTSAPGGDAFSETNQRVLNGIAEIAANALHRAQLHDEAVLRAEQLAAVNLLGRGLAETLEEGEVYARVHEAVLKLLPDTRGLYLFLCNPDRRQLTCVFGRQAGQAVDVAAMPPASLDSPAAGPAAEAVHTRQPVLVQDAESPGDPVALGADSRGGPSRLFVPMLAKGSAVGVMQAESDRAGGYGEAETELLSFVASMTAVAVRNAQLFAETRRSLENMQALRNIDIAITGSMDLRVTLDILLSQAVSQLGVDAADVLRFNPHTRMLEFAAGQGFRTPALRYTRLRLGEGFAGRAALRRELVQVTDLSIDPGSLSKSSHLADEGFRAYVGVPLVAKGQLKGVLELFHRQTLATDGEWTRFLEALAGQAAIAMDGAELFESLERSNVDLTLAYDTTLEGWSKALDLRDRETVGHTQRVTEMAVRLARAAGMGEGEITHLRRGALLHDIGKMGIPDSILHKPGALNDEEWEVMRRHPSLANDLLSPIAFLRPALDIPYAHHEKWDGTGYPRKLQGEQIPLAARLFAVADVWDALTSDRPYRPAWPAQRALSYIREQSGKHFDPRAVEIFLGILGQGEPAN